MLHGLLHEARQLGADCGERWAARKRQFKVGLRSCSLYSYLERFHVERMLIHTPPPTEEPHYFLSAIPDNKTGSRFQKKSYHTWIRSPPFLQDQLRRIQQRIRSHMRRTFPQRLGRRRPSVVLSNIKTGILLGRMTLRVYGGKVHGRASRLGISRLRGSGPIAGERKASVETSCHGGIRSSLKQWLERGPEARSLPA